MDEPITTPQRRTGTREEWIPMASRFALLTVLAAVVAGCAGPAPAADPSPDTDPEDSVVIPIGPDGPELPEDVVEALQAYGAEHADEFGGLYVEDQSRGSFGMFFTDRLDEHAAALAEIWPRVTVRRVRYSEAALMDVLERLDLPGMAGPGIEPLSAAIDTMNNVVTLELKSDDPGIETLLELQYGDMLDVTVYPFPGDWANVTSGDGWRLLAAGQASHTDAYTVRAATNEAQFVEMWAAMALGGERPAVDFGAEVVVSFGHGIGSSCPELRLDDVSIRDGVVHSVTSDPLEPRGCTADLVGASVFVVAVERDALPEDGFRLQLDADGGPNCEGCTATLEVSLP
jgi:hypothetical protein